VLRHLVTLFCFFARKFRRAMNLPVSDLSDSRTRLGQSIHAMEAPPKVEPPRSES
jgi:hypothetical protein